MASLVICIFKQNNPWVFPELFWVGSSGIIVGKNLGCRTFATGLRT
jgi:hypothetical protein